MYKRDHLKTVESGVTEEIGMIYLREKSVIVRNPPDSHLFGLTDVAEKLGRGQFEGYY